MQAAGSDVETRSLAGHATLGGLFMAALARHASRIALTCGDQHLSYAALNEAAAQVAAGLKARGIGPGALAGICMERGIAMLIAMLGIIKAGAAYLPLDPRYPTQRLQETIADSHPAAVIFDAGGIIPGLGSEIPALTLGELRGTWDEDVNVTPQDLAYVIYTSGSTGRPKGVEVTHGNVAALLRATEGLFQLSPDDVWTMFHSFAFDFSVWEMWGCLLTGARLVIVPFEVSRAPDEFRKVLARERVTVLNQTPSAFALLDRVDASHAPGELALRLVIFGGEALAGSALCNWFGRHGDQRPELVNMYGITETTVHVTHRTMRIADADELESLMGEPLPGWTIDLIDDEIWVGGAGVARGYLGRQQLTTERFVGGLYRSGDLARRRPDGELVYLGRRDGQVKVNGFRIETGEVEAALRGCEGVQQACVIARESRLVAYVVCGHWSSAAPSRATTLSEQLKRKLPSHMVPSLYVELAALPLNPNGKIDRSALPEPMPHTLSGPVARTGTEKLVADIWAGVLGTQVSAEVNFFDVGGTSLLLIAVRADLQKQLARTIPVTWMFECTTIRTLARRLDEGIAQPPAPVRQTTNADRQRQAFAKAREMRGPR